MKSIYFLLIFILAYFPAMTQPVVPPIEDGTVALSRELITMMNTGQFDKAYQGFDSTMKKFFDQSKMSQTWQMIIGQYGKFKGFGDGATVQSVKGVKVVTLPAVFDKSELNFRVAYDKDKQVTGFFIVPKQAAVKYKAPAYVKTDKFKDQDVKIGSGATALSGKLSVPVGKGPFPALVLVHGSGPNDRDETVGQNKPFRDIAWGLASQGIAVLRYEKRTKEHADQMIASLDSLTINEETVNDAFEAAEMLSKNTAINPDKIFILGHSLGGIAAPRIGQRYTKAAGLVIMAGTDRQLQDIYIEQIEYLTSLQGKPDSADIEKINTIKEQVRLLNSDKVNLFTSRDSLPMSLPPKYWLDLKSYSPAATLMSLKMPVLILQGERDYQVDMKSYRQWQDKLKGRKNTDYKLYPKLNHLFMEGEGPGSPQEYNKESHIPEYVIKDIADWINRKN